MKLDPFPFVDAVKYFWNRKQGQVAEQAARKSYDQGLRSAVTGGNHMNGFVMTLVDHLKSNEVPMSDIFTRRSETYLPGYFRSSKQWDLVIFRKQQVLAVIELKSQGSSFGNNFNNRTEEALGNSEDFWTAYREGLLGKADPFLGFLYLIESHPGSLSPVKNYAPILPVLQEFEGASYRDRLGLLCKKLMLERKYSSACGIESQKDAVDLTPNYHDIANSDSSNMFVERFTKRVLEHY